MWFIAIAVPEYREDLHHCRQLRFEMFQSLAKIAVNLDLDNVVNRFMDRIYSSRCNGSSRLRRRFQILVFHKVSPHSQPYFEAVHPDVFEGYAKVLNRCYQVMDLSELV